jgi:hypothetical protein
MRKHWHRRESLPTVLQAVGFVGLESGHRAGAPIPMPPAADRRPSDPWARLVRRLFPQLACLALALVAGGLLSGCLTERDAGDRGRRSGPATDAPLVWDGGPIHVHALGVNPADGVLFIATHTGLFRTPRPGMSPKRVAGRYQDTMGFTVIGPNHFLASGHPDGREALPPFLGLIESTDAGRSWKAISLQGQMDFHVLEAAGRRIYGFGSEWKSRRERFLVSDDGGRSWDERPVPEPLIDLAVSPDDPATAVAAGQNGLYLTSDAGRRWRTLSGASGLLSWLDRGLYVVDRAGAVRVGTRRGRRWRLVGRVRGQPAAFASSWTGAELYVALQDGTIKRSSDGGASWRADAAQTGAGVDGRSAGGQSRASRQPNRTRSAREDPLARRGRALRDLPGVTAGSK